jgi:hypothetical protein
MTDYAVLLFDDERLWDAASPEHKAQTYARHEEFSKALADRGHVVFGGAQLTPTREATVLRADPSGGAVRGQGPYTETVEQVGGFYLVRTDDLADLTEVCTMLTDTEGGLEIREMMADPGQ